MFDRPEHADRQMHVELGGAVKPAVVRQVDEHIGLPASLGSRKKRAITWGTVSSKQMLTASR